MYTGTVGWQLHRDDAKATLAKKASAGRMPLKVFQTLVGEHPVQSGAHALSEKAFVAKFGYGYDACIVFPHDEKKGGMTASRKVLEVCEKLKKGRVDHRWFVSELRTEVFVLLRVTVHRLAKAADDLDWPVLLCEVECEKRAKWGDVRARRRAKGPFAV